MRLVLFDVDGTLVISGGAGSRALKRAIHETYGLPDSLDGVRVHGKTDPGIVREALQHYGKERLLTKKSLTSLFSAYVGYLRDELKASEKFRVLPGARELVCSLSRDPELLLGLATGNVEKGAQLKMERAGLDSFFTFGGYGSDAEDRTELIQAAIDRGKKKVSSRKAEAVYMIGDTPRDIVHGKEAGTHTIAVASGFYSLAALEGYKPDLAVESLEPIEPVVEFLSGEVERVST